MATISDMFSAEDRVSVKFNDFYMLMKTAAKAEVILDLSKVEEDPWWLGRTMQKLALGELNEQ